MKDINYNYNLIYLWLKNTGAKIANNEIKGKVPFNIPDKAPLRLIENIPDPKVATDAEINAIAVEIRSGLLEYFYWERENESGLYLSQLAKEICLSVKDSDADLNKHPSKICQYLSKFTNANI